MISLLNTISDKPSRFKLEEIISYNADMRFRGKVDGSHFNSSPSTFCTEPSDVHMEKITVTETFIYEKHCDIEVDVNDIDMSKSNVQGDTPIAILFRLAINDPRMKLVSGFGNCRFDLFVRFIRHSVSRLWSMYDFHWKLSLLDPNG